MTPNAERAAIAREVLLAALQYMRDEGFASKERDAMVRYIERVAPPAQVTVTVDDVEWYRMPCDGGWGTYGDDTPPNAADAQDFLDRIAADARRIAELEESERTLAGHLNQVYEELRPVSDGEYLAVELATLAVARIAELEHERDEARRALEAMRLTPTQGGSLRPVHVQDATKGEGRGEVGVSTAAHGGSSATQPDHGESPVAAPSPAQIPLGATVEVEGTRWTLGTGADDEEWCTDDGDVTHTLDHDAALAALYHARHPVATRETVERVERALRGVRGGLGSSHDWMYAQAARAALTAMGVTIQEGA